MPQIIARYLSNFSFLNHNFRLGSEFFGENPGDYSGYPVKGSGDVNGDGKDDLIIGAYNAQAGTGFSYVVFGDTYWPFKLSLSTLNGSNGLKFIGESSGDKSGYSVSGAGDVNGDGKSDILVGAYGAGNNRGSVYLVFGHDQSWLTPFNLSLINGSNGVKFIGENLNDYAGLCVSEVGDVDGNGIADFVIGAYGPNSNAGASYLIFGHGGNWTSPISLSTLNGVNGVKFTGENPGDYSGWSVSGAGDINGDNRSDLLIGGYGAYGGKGASYLVFGHSGNWPNTISLSTINGISGTKIIGESISDYSGYPVSNGGDVNGDGIDDILIGAYGVNSDAGASYLIFGHRGNWTSPINLSTLSGDSGVKIRGESPGDHSGWSLSGTGDVNGDGIDDVLIGAYGVNSNAGASYLIFGHSGNWTSPMSLSTLNGTNGFKIRGEGPGDYSGWSVSGAGDVNGDDVSDFSVGAFGFNHSAGIIYVVLGEPQWTLNNPTPIPLTQGGSFFLNSTYLNTTHTDPSKMQFTTADPQHLIVESVAQPGQPITTFNQQSQNAGLVRATHDGSCYPPSLSVSASTGLLSTSSLPLDFLFSPNPPVITGNQLSVSHGGTVTLTLNNLNVTDSGDPAGNWEFTASDVQHGQFSLISNPTAPITQFNKQQVINGVVQFGHDSSVYPPSYKMSARNVCGVSSTAAPALVTFGHTSTPTPLKGQVFYIEGQSPFVVTTDNLNCSSIYVDQPYDNLKVVVSSMENFKFTSSTDGSDISTMPLGVLDVDPSHLSPNTTFVVGSQVGTGIPSGQYRCVDDQGLSSAPLPIEFTYITPPGIAINNLPYLNQTDRVPLCSRHIACNSSSIPEGIVPLSSLQVGIVPSSITNAFFDKSTTPGVAVYKFSMADLDACIPGITATSNTYPSFDVYCEDPATDHFLNGQSLKSGVQSADIKKFNDIPVKVNAEIDAVQATCVPITRDQLFATQNVYASEPWNTADDINIRIESISHADIYRINGNQTTLMPVGSEIKQKTEISAIASESTVCFKADQSTIPPTCVVSFLGRKASQPISTVVGLKINRPAPILTVNGILYVNRGIPVPLSNIVSVTYSDSSLTAEQIQSLITNTLLKFDTEFGIVRDTRSVQPNMPDSPVYQCSVSELRYMELMPISVRDSNGRWIAPKLSVSAENPAPPNSPAGTLGISNIGGAKDIFINFNAPVVTPLIKRAVVRDLPRGGTYLITAEDNLIGESLGDDASTLKWSLDCQNAKLIATATGSELSSLDSFTPLNITAPRRDIAMQRADTNEQASCFVSLSNSDTTVTQSLAMPNLISRYKPGTLSLISFNYNGLAGQMSFPVGIINLAGRDNLGNAPGGFSSPLTYPIIYNGSTCHFEIGSREGEPVYSFADANIGRDLVIVRGGSSDATSDECTLYLAVNNTWGVASEFTRVNAKFSLAEAPSFFDTRFWIGIGVSSFFLIAGGLLRYKQLMDADKKALQDQNRNSFIDFVMKELRERVAIVVMLKRMAFCSIEQDLKEFESAVAAIKTELSGLGVPTDIIVAEKMGEAISPSSKSGSIHIRATSAAELKNESERNELEYRGLSQKNGAEGEIYLSKDKMDELARVVVDCIRGLPVIKEKGCCDKFGIAIGVKTEIQPGDINKGTFEARNNNAKIIAINVKKELRKSNAWKSLLPEVNPSAKSVASNPLEVAKIVRKHDERLDNHNQCLEKIGTILLELDPGSVGESAALLPQSADHSSVSISDASTADIAKKLADVQKESLMMKQVLNKIAGVLVPRMDSAGNERKVRKDDVAVKGGAMAGPGAGPASALSALNSSALSSTRSVDSTSSAVIFSSTSRTGKGRGSSSRAASARGVAVGGAESFGATVVELAPVPVVSVLPASSSPDSETGSSHEQPPPPLPMDP